MFAIRGSHTRLEGNSSANRNVAKSGAGICRIGGEVSLHDGSSADFNIAESHGGGICGLGANVALYSGSSANNNTAGEFDLERNSTKQNETKRSQTQRCTRS